MSRGLLTPFDFVTGVPCTSLAGLFAEAAAAREDAELTARAPYVAAVREDTALGIAAGAALAGRRPAVLMQNSGLGTCLTALASLTALYSLPATLVVGWRGHDGRDAPEHELTGRISRDLLELAGVPCRIPSRASVADDLAWAARTMAAAPGPVALLVPPGSVPAPADGEPARTAPGPADPARPAGRTATVSRASTAPVAVAARAPAARSWATPASRDRLPRLTRAGAVAAALAEIGDNVPVVHANGMLCRESFAVGDRPASFYMLGSMGLAPAIGLGLALARPDLPVVVFDGDGNLLMNLGVLPMIGALAPGRLVHLVFDNGVYGSTGDQPSPAPGCAFEALAVAAGYASADRVDTTDGLAAAVRRSLAAPGPHFVRVRVAPSATPAPPRIPFPPSLIRDRFRASLPSAPAVPVLDSPRVA